MGGGSCGGTGLGSCDFEKKMPGVYGEGTGVGGCPVEEGWPLMEEKEVCDIFEKSGRYETLISVEYETDKPFPRTFIVEEDSTLGRRETCLYSTLNKINSEVCTSR